MARLRTLDARPWIETTVAWAVPVIVIFLIYFSPRHLLSAEAALTGVLAFGIVLLAAKNPGRSLLLLIVLFPFQTFLLSLLYKAGLPASVVHHLGSWKEALAIGVLIAGIRNLLATGRRLDAVDKLAVGFVAVVALYALLGPTIVPGTTSTGSLRWLGFRETGAFVLVLFGARHAPLGPGFARRAGSALIAVGAIVAGAGVFQAIAPATWNRFVVLTIGYPHYQQSVLHTQLANPFDITVYGTVGGAQIVRIGSFFIDQLTLSFWLVLPFAVAFERVIRRSATPAVLATTILIGAALLLTQTRSAIIAALIVALLALQPAAGRPRHWRTQAALVLVGLALLAVPAAFGTSLASRIGATNTAADTSSAGHLSAFSVGVRTLGAHPLGQGLATGAGTGQRYHVASTVIPENTYLELGDEIGVLPMALFIGLTIVLLVNLRRAARQGLDPLVTASWAAGVGLAISGLFLQTWVAFAVSWTYWGTAGAMLGLAGHSRARIARRPAEIAPARLPAPVPGY